MSHPPLTDDQRTMVEQNLGLVGFVIRMYYPTHQGDDDAFQAGVLGLMRASVGYDIDRGCKFSTYACDWIRQAIGKGMGDFDGINARRARAKGQTYEPPMSLNRSWVAGDGGASLDRLLADVDVGADPAEIGTLRALLESWAAALRECADDDLDRDLAAHLLDLALGQRPEGLKTISSRHGYTYEYARRRLIRLRARAAEHAGLVPA